MKKAWVYMLSNKRRNVLYIGVTNNLPARLKEHQAHANPDSFTSRYNCTDLVYYEDYDNMELAIKREKQLKGWRREKKDNLIISKNPDLDTLDIPTVEEERHPEWRRGAL